MRLLLHFFAGAFLCNGIPHFISGLMGHPFPTPFARPPGVGNSSPLVNVLWGCANFLVVIAVLGRWPIAIGPNPAFVGFSVGFLAMGTGLAHHFGKVMRARAAR
jgi:hypothetical protein